MSDIRNKKPPTLNSYRLLTNPLAVKIFDENKICQLLTNFVYNAHSGVLEKGLEQIFKNHRISGLIPAFSQDIKWFSSNGFIMGLQPYRLIQYYLALFNIHKASLTNFVDLRNKVEHAILISKFDSAMELLDEIEEKFGESIWLTRSKMLVLSRLGNRERFTTYCKLYEERSDNSFNTFILKCAQVIADSGNATLQLSNVVRRNITELREAKKEFLSSLLGVLFVPQPLEPEADNISCLPYIQGYPIIDQYTIISTILRLELTKEHPDVDNYSGLLEFVAQLDKSVHDNRIQNLVKLSSAIEIGPLPSNPSAKSMLESYDAGNYSAAISQFFAMRDESDESLCYVNIVAKSMAYCNYESTLDSRSDLMTSVAGNLSTIYRLSPLWGQAEEQLTSLSIQYNHFSHGPLIQLSLLKALTFRYSIKSQITSAKQAISLSHACTTETFAMAGYTPPFLSSADMQIRPRHSSLKSQILSELALPVLNTTLIETKLEELSQSDALVKDIVECRAKYLFKNKKDVDLVQDAAKNLILDTNRFICYPMEHLIDAVENLSLHDLPALIVAYHYNVSVSDERDYVLNEAFDTYVRRHSAIKPSEILFSKDVLTAEEAVFFRDICIPDVMDSLGIFKNSNDLRSERLIILDALESRGNIDPTTRMREVEEIVRQVIVDTGTSELNGAKIFVNDNALKRKHFDEVRSFLSLYEKIPSGSDERYTKLDDDATGGYISGSRNSLIERLYNMLSNSFLFDEKYGLDRNLSAEIRHGFFSNLMRARLEELHLLTELDEKGEYLPNIYWREKNSLVRDVYWEEIDVLLAKFSRKFDQIVAEAEEWMKIEIQANEGAGMFSFNLTMGEFANIRSVVEQTGDTEYVCSSIFDLLWQKTDHALTALRDRLNADFKANIDIAFRECIEELTEVKGDLALFDLMQSFTTARNIIQEDINTASDWFNKTKNSEINAGNLARLIEIAVRSFEKVRGNAFSINISPLNEISRIAVNKQVTKPFILAIINLLDNCYAHSGLGQDTLVEITGSAHGCFATVAIQNNLSSEKQTQLTARRFDEINKKLLSSDISKHIRGEGGTGLIKAKHEISYLGRTSQLEISRTNEYFNSSITYDSTVTT